MNVVIVTALQYNKILFYSWPSTSVTKNWKSSTSSIVMYPLLISLPEPSFFSFSLIFRRLLFFPFQLFVCEFNMRWLSEFEVKIQNNTNMGCWLASYLNFLRHFFHIQLNTRYIICVCGSECRCVCKFFVAWSKAWKRTHNWR